MPTEMLLGRATIQPGEQYESIGTGPGRSVIGRIIAERRGAEATRSSEAIRDGAGAGAPMSESDPRYPKLSGVEKEEFLKDWKKELEQGLLNAILKPPSLGIGHDLFVYSEHTFEGNPLSEFCSISRNILDCFATALLSTPDLDFALSPLVVRCRLGEEGKNLTLYLTAMLAPGEQILPLEWKEESEVWIAGNLRSLAKAKGLSLGNIFWDRSGQHSFFFFDYPGQMIRDKVPGLGAPGDDGKPRWPECELLLDSVSVAMREKAKHAVDFVQSNTDGPIQ